MGADDHLLSKRRMIAGSTLSVMITATACASASLVSDNRRVDRYSEALQSRKFKQEPPFSADFRRGSYALTFVATKHSVDPQSPTFQKVAAAFLRARPAKLIIEGVDTAWGENPEDITSMIPERLLPNANSFARSEAVYAASLAVSAGIPFIGGEPTGADLTAALISKGFQPQDIFFTNILKSLNQNRIAGEFVTPSDSGFARAYSDWSVEHAQITKTIAPTFSEFEGWYTRTFNKALATDPDWAERFYPSTQTVSGRISATEMLLRDRHIHDLTIASLQSVRRVMIVYGASHLATLWDALTAALGPPRIW